VELLTGRITRVKDGALLAIYCARNGNLGCDLYHRVCVGSHWEHIGRSCNFENQKMCN